MSRAVTVARAIVLTIAAIAPPSAFAAADATTAWVLAHEDVAAHPWVHPDGSGLDPELIQAAARSLAQPVRLESLPWTRCLAMLEAGQIDGLIAASYTAERAAFAAYPLLPGGQPDPARRLHIDTYGIFKLVESPLEFDGERLLNLDGRIAAQSGFSIVDTLRGLGAEVDQDSKELEPILRRLLAGRVVGAALLTTAVDHYLQDHREFVPRIVKIPTDLESKPYYLVFSLAHYRSHAERCQALWAKIAELRELRDSGLHQRRLRRRLHQER